MSDNTREPENSEVENLEVPTSRKEGDVYARAGRVAPQKIPAAPQQTPTPEEEPAPVPFSEQTPTVTFDPREHLDEDVDIPVAPPQFVQAPQTPAHPSDAPTTVFEPQAAEPKPIPSRSATAEGAKTSPSDDPKVEAMHSPATPAGEPTVMFDAPSVRQNPGFTLPEPGEEDLHTAQGRSDFQSRPEQTTTLPPYSQVTADEQFRNNPSDSVVSQGAPVAVAEEHSAVPAESLPPQADARRGTIDFGIFIIRAVFGFFLIFLSVKTFFQLGGDTGLAGLEAEYANYLQPGILAVAIPAMLLTAGVFLLLGLVTPVAAAIATTGTAFEALHLIDTDGEAFNLLRIGDGVILGIIFVAISIGLQFTGPGRLSLDFGRSWARRPLISSWVFALLGLAGAAALWWFGAGVNPFN
ncbi:DoxX family protein [Corynebacterium freiburgense]|uniref:DoxX family protein n=1 Tax=Corynebacterium freiburgense TaxID=556548 RepID=UPI0004074533|nr:DoxX family protein [Corynebacterium freiburgense]WJZ02434.1 Putative oxidoreductase MhqP [Corynebacterium freiburgense]